MKSFVNFLSLFRIVAAFAIIPLFVFGINDWVFWIFLAAALTDFFDGYLARKFNVCTKIGAVMDSTGDKFLVANALILMAATWRIMAVPVILLIARELYVSGLREFMGSQHIEMGVPKYRFSPGKIKAAVQMTAIALYFFMVSNPYANDDVLMPLVRWGLWLAVALSLLSAAQYTKTFAQNLKKLKH